MSTDGIEALLFDFGGVVVKIDFRRAFAKWAEYADCDASALAARFSFDDAYERHERGEIIGEEYFGGLRTVLDLNLSTEQLVEGWNAIFLGEIQGISDVLARAKMNHPLYLFSNSNPTHEAFWTKRYASVLSNFKRRFISSTIGLRKPEPAAFECVSRSIGLGPARIMFFDDLIENVEGAKAIGMKAVHVQSTFDVIAELSILTQ